MTPAKFSYPISQTELTYFLNLLQKDKETVVRAIASDAWKIVSHKVHLTAQYAGEILTVTVTDKPFYVPLSAVDNGLKEKVAEYAKIS